ncbi:hypothetical protein I4U23_031406 [Adineta vaga]|nr:hypothetical protein I4U23_031406 [Adineta vaga]
MDTLSTLILNERFWLPANTTWKDFARLEQEENIKLTKSSDLLYAFPLAGVVYLIRVLFERYIAKPIGRSLGIRDRYARKTTTDRETIPTNVKQTYKQQHVASSSSSSSSRGRYTPVGPLVKFSESCWRLVFYLSVFIYGVVILQNVSV